MTIPYSSTEREHHNIMSG